MKIDHKSYVVDENSLLQQRKYQCEFKKSQMTMTYEIKIKLEFLELKRKK